MKIYAISGTKKTNSIIKLEKKSGCNSNVASSDIPSFNVAFGAVQNLSGVTTKIKTNKSKMLNVFKEILASQSMFKTASELEAHRKKRALNVLKYKLKRHNELSAVAEYIIASNPNGVSNADKQRLEGILGELKKLQKIPLYEEPKKSKYDTDDYDLVLINLFQKALLDDNFDLRPIYKDYYKGLEQVETLKELKMRYPAIKIPKNPLDNIAQRVLNLIPQEMHQKYQAYKEFGDKHYAMRSDIADDMFVFLKGVITTMGLNDDADLLINLGERVISDFKRMNSSEVAGSNQRFAATKPNKGALITDLERELLQIDYEKFVLKVIKDHYLNDAKLNDIVYEEDGKTIKVASYKDTEYKFEKKSEKIKKIIVDAEKIKLIQRDYSKYNQEDLKTRLEFYGNSELAGNQELFNLICEFHACKFVAEDRGYLIKLLTVLDKVNDQQISLDDAIKYLKENNVKPLGTHKVNSIERQKVKEELLQERLLNQTLKKAQDEFYSIINNLYANNLGQIVEICSKYYPEKADYSTIIDSLIFLGLIKEIADNNDAEIAQNKILCLEAYKESSESEADSKIYRDALVYVKNISFEDNQDDLVGPVKNFVKSFLPEKQDLSLYSGAFTQLENVTLREKAGQYILKRNVIEGYPESKDLVPYPKMLEKIMQNFGGNKNLATELLCKYHDYYVLKDEEKSFIANIMKIFDLRKQEDKVILKDIIENDFINSDTSIWVAEGNVPKARTIASTAKQELYDKYRFPNSVLYFEKFEDALPLNARSENSSGVKKTDRNNKKALYKAEVKIMGHDDRLVADNNDYYFNHFLPGGMH